MTRAPHAWDDPSADASLLYDSDVGRVPIRKKSMKRHERADDRDPHQYRKSIEAVNSQLESTGLKRLRARANGGFYVRVQATLVALWHTQAMAN